MGTIAKAMRAVQRFGRAVPLLRQSGRAATVRCLATPGPVLESEADKCFYAIGINCGRQMGELKCLSHEELDRVLLGMKDVITSQEFKVDLETIMPKAAAMFQAKQVESADKAIESGLVILETKAGEGKSPHWKDKVKVHYEGRLPDGTVFDSSMARGEPIEFGLGGVIRGWTEGLQLMKPGGKATLTIPSDLAYGDGGQMPTIPGKATLIFDVELIAIV